MNEIEQSAEREACRKAFEFDLIDNWMYVESDFALDESGLYADRELYFAWECAWASWQAARAIPEGWALVPIEPTREMWQAVNKLDDEMAAGGYDGKGCSIEQAWECLIEHAARPLG